MHSNEWLREKLIPRKRSVLIVNIDWYPSEIGMNNANYALFYCGDTRRSRAAALKAYKHLYGEAAQHDTAAITI